MADNDGNAKSKENIVIAGENGDDKEPKIPDTLPVLPARDAVLFPDMILPLVVTTDRDTKLVDHVLLNGRFLALVPMNKETDGPPSTDDMFTHGTAAVVLKMLKFPDDSVRILVQGLKRLKIKKYVQQDPFFIANTKLLEDKVPQRSVRLDALHHSIREQFHKFVNLLPQFPEEVRVASVNITEPGRFADLVASNINISMAERCMILEEDDIRLRLEKLSLLLGRELQIVELGSKIQQDVKSKIDQGQREFFLREQLKAIRHELGEDDDARVEVEELHKQLAEAKLPEEARKEADRELKRLERMQPGSAEYTVSRTYLDWMISLPWQKMTEDRLDVVKARKILDSDHYDLTKVKDRIIEFLAVRKIHPEGRSPILCFAGPPGVGKTSLGRSIARAMGREFVRISLGGVRDEAEIRGHRRTYIGALPGRIIQGLRKAGTRNPVFMMDEIDKLVSDFRGDPSAALLEVLDPEQNNAFSDHYLDAAFDLSQVIFITTANQIDTIPAALRDRMEILNIPGYAEEEKFQIAKKHLIPRIL
ncbi:MAG: endopeptidase La, partial [Planctomycetes bacterium]|nr:endopeptidase La [Planctomycetota bacterium]